MKLSAFGRPAIAGAIIIILSLIALGANAASVIPVPPGLNPGDPYRLVFVTSGSTDATSIDINYYNGFVQGFATAADLGSGWTAIGSTAVVNARLNTGTDPLLNGTGVPIYLLDGTLVALNNADLWDGSIAAPINLTETYLPQPDGVWTGTDSNGLTQPNKSLGSVNINPAAWVGKTEKVDEQWIYSGNILYITTLSNAMYALSPELTAPVPVPAAGFLFMSALLGLAGRKRLSR